MNKPPTKCIACQSYNINCEGDQHEDELIFVYMNCRECGETWTEMYQFLRLSMPYTPETQPAQKGDN